jgi:hypothetical protein
VRRLSFSGFQLGHDHFNQFLHKLHHRLTKLSAAPILMSSQRQYEMQWEERVGKMGRSMLAIVVWVRCSPAVLLAAMVRGRGAHASDRQDIVSMRPILPQQGRDEVGRPPNDGISRLACLPSDLCSMIE